MAEQEKAHLQTFNALMVKHQVRPTIMTPIWDMAGYALGMGTALMGKEAAMACTVAVETVIAEHYNNQLRQMNDAGYNTEEDGELRKVIFRSCWFSWCGIHGLLMFPSRCYESLEMMRSPTSRLALSMMPRGYVN